MKTSIALIATSALLIVASCASQAASTATDQAVSETRAGFADAAMTPLEDLNLKRDAIPAALQDIGNPYKVSADITCQEIETQIIALNDVLGPDWDASADEDNPTLSERAGDAASDGVLGAVASEAGGILPYRGWVRQLTGAKAHEKKIEQAYKRGAHRRTYLKALGMMKGCAPVAVPQIAPGEEEQKIIFHGDAPDGYKPMRAEPEIQPLAIAGTPPPRTDLRPAAVAEEPLGGPDQSQPLPQQTNEAPRAMNPLPQPAGQLGDRPAPSHDGTGSSPSDGTSSPSIYD